MGLLRESSTRDRRRVLAFSLVGVVFVLVYLLLFPRALPREFTLLPETATPLAGLASPNLDAGGSFFVLGNWEGYWNAAGELQRSQPRRAQATASGESLAWYDPDHDQVVVEGLKGTRFTLPGEKYPTWARGRLFTLDENRLGVKAFDSEGRLQWNKQFSSLITALDTSANLTVVGTLDGRVQIFNARGESVGGFQPGGSRISVVYNVAVAPQDGAILVLAGVEPKRFLVLERGGSEFRPVYHKPLKENRPWPTPLGFLGPSLAYYETDSGLAFLDPRNPHSEVSIAVEGTPLLLESLPQQTLALVEKRATGSTLRVSTPMGASLLTLPFTSSDLLVQRQSDVLMVGVDQTLLRFRVRFQ